MDKKVWTILFLISAIINIGLIITNSSLSSQVDDCIREIDGFKAYYDATETFLSTPDSVDYDGKVKENYESAKSNIISTYNGNHPNEIGLDKKIIEK